MKATTSQDGVLRVDLRVTHRMGLDELADALCSAMRGHGEDDGPLPPLSPAKTLEMIREELWLRGGSEGLGGWSDDMYDATAEGRLAWARRRVLAAVPELG